MKKSIRWKLCWVGTSLIATFVVINIILTYFFMPSFSTLFYRDQMSDLGDSLEQMTLTEEQHITDVIEDFDISNGVKITIIDGEKNILYTTKAFMKATSEYWKMSTKLFDGERDKIDAGEKVFLTRNKQNKASYKSIQLIMLQKIDDNCYAVISRSYQSLYNAMYSAIIFDIVVGVLIILFGWSVVYRLSHHLVVPLRKMTATAELISNLDFYSKVEVNSMDEIGQLGNSINKMSERLEKNVSQLQDDIEKRKRLVRNLSHEIKSPIAVIMGYSDRMKAVIDKNPEKAIAYSEIISNESARIDALVKEMLELSKMEQQTEEAKFEEIEVRTLYQCIENRFKEETLEKNIQLSIEYNEKDIIYGDYILLERAIYNLVDNAISHGSGEQIQINISSKLSGEYYEFRVFNTGSHIDELELDCIWEPFNMVDKVRSRGKQGYGVGLSIVQEIVELHEGYCAVKNVEDGVEFHICISCLLKKVEPSKAIVL